ncbi:MAG: hypothetical protein QM750_00115 [Rubrivivax sp.]
MTGGSTTEIKARIGLDGAQQFQTSAKATGESLNALATSNDRFGQSSQSVAQQLSQLKASFGGLSSAASLLGPVLASAAGAFSVEAIRRVTMGFYEEADALGKLSKSTGIAIEQLSGLAEVGRYSGQSAEAIGRAANFMAKALSETSEEGKGAAGALRALGLDFDAFKSKTPDQQMLTLAKSMTQFEDGAGKSAAAMKLLGKSGADMLPFLNDLASKGIAAAAVTTEMAQQSEAFNDMLEESLAATQRFARGLAMSLLPELINARKLTGELGDTWGRYLRGSAADAASGVDGLGVALSVVGTTMETVSVLGANVAFVLRGIGTELGGLAAQAAAVAHGEFAGAGAIGTAMKEDAARARAELDKFERSVLGATERLMAQRDAARAAALATRDLGAAAEDAGRKKTLTFFDSNGADGKELEREAKLLAELAGLSSSYAGDLQTLQRARAAGNVSEARYVELVGALIQKQPFAAAQARLLADAGKERAKALADVVKATADHAGALAKELDAGAKTNESLRDQIDGLRYGKEAILDKTQAHLDLMAAMNDQAAVQSLLDGLSMAESAAYSERAAQLREEAQLRRDLAAAGVAKEASEKAAADWAKTIDGVRDGLTGAFRDAFASGERFGTAFARSIGNEIKTQIAAALAGTLANGAITMLFGGTASGKSGAGAASSYLQSAQTMSTLYGYGQKAYGWAGGLWSGGTSATYGTTGVVGANGAFLGEASGVESGIAAWDSAATSAGASWGAIAGWIAAAIWAGMEGSSDWSAGLRREQARDTNTAIGDASARTAQLMDDLGVSDRWADILSGATLTARIGKELGMLATPHMGGYALATAGGVQDITKQQGGIQDAAVQGLVGSFAADTLKLIGSFASSFGTSSNVASVRSVFESDNNDPSWGLFHLMDQAGGRVAGFDALGTLASSASEGFAEYTKQAAGSIVDALTQIDIPKWAKSQLEALGDDIDLTKLSTGVAGVVAYEKQLNSLTGTLALLGPTFERIDAASSDTVQSLIGMAGGIDSFRGAAASYFENYYNETERVDITFGQIGKALGEVGLELPSSRDAFRSLVDGLDPMTEAGQQAYTMLMSVQQAFADVVPAAEAAAAATRSIADIARERADLQMELWRALGDQASIDTYTRSKIDVSNLDLYDQIKAAEAAAAAASAVSMTWQDVGSTAVTAAALAKSSWTDAADNIKDEILRLRGQVAGKTTAAGFAAAQGDFAVVLAQAKAGDSEAAKSLPGLSKAMIDMAGDFVSSTQALELLQARTAAALEDLLKVRGLSVLGAQASVASSVLSNLRVPGFAAGGDFGGGLALVGERGPELVLTGAARIYNADQTRQAMNGEQTQEIRALRAEIVSLQHTVERLAALLSNIENNTHMTQRTLRQVTQGGTAVRTKEISS